MYRLTPPEAIKKDIVRISLALHRQLCSVAGHPRLHQHEAVQQRFSVAREARSSDEFNLCSRAAAKAAGKFSRLLQAESVQPWLVPSLT